MPHPSGFHAKHWRLTCRAASDCDASVRPLSAPAISSKYPRFGDLVLLCREPTSSSVTQHRCAIGDAHQFRDAVTDHENTGAATLQFAHFPRKAARST